MSWAALAWAVRQKLPSTQKLVLIMLAERHNSDTGRCDPSHGRLADDCGLSSRSVMDQIAKLETAGYLRSFNRVNGNVKLSNYYVLHLNFGIQQDVKAVPDDPFLVLNVVQGGTERDSGGVLNDVQEGTEPRSHKPVNEPVNKPNTKNNKKGSSPKAEVQKPDGVGETVWADWLAHRKAKRALVTQTVLDDISREAQMAGYTLEMALTTCCSRGWQGFKADWVQQRGHGQHAPRETAYQQQMRERVAALTPRFAVQQPKQQAGDFFRDQAIDVQASVVDGARMIGGQR